MNAPKNHPGNDSGTVGAPVGFRSHAAALAGFIVLTLVMTYPTALRMGSSVADAADPLFNTWVIAWNARSLTTGNLQGLFDTNIFYPAPNTAAYSEFLIPQSLIAAPVLWISDNPILAYNVALLAAIVTSAFGAYLLGAYLTDRIGGLLAGIVFAFNPFMMNHLTHVQFLSAFGIPLAFLYLHKFLGHGRTRHLLLFSLFYVLQSLANTYYALYLTLFAGLYIVFHVVRRKRYLDLRFWLHMALHVSIALLMLGPFFFRYFALRRDFGMMIRRDESVATALSFLATSPINRLYGAATAGYFQNEAALFPGVLAVLLAAVGIWGGFKLRDRELRYQGPRSVAVVYRATTLGLVLLGILVVEILTGGGVDVSIGSIPIRSASVAIPLALVVVTWVARWALERRYAIRVRASGAWDSRLVYLGMLALGLALTIPSGLSTFVHQRVPGFDGMRSASRIHVMTMLAIAILAAYGMAAVSERFGRRRGGVVATVLGLGLCIEYLSVPAPAVAVPTRKDAPEVYRWLAAQNEDFAFVEYPILTRLQIWQTYFSTYHWKRLVTGASAFPAGTYIELVQRDEAVPSPSTLDDFERIGVRYLVVHEWPNEEVDPAALQAALDRLSDRLQLVATLASYDLSGGESGRHRVLSGGRARVYELTRSDWRPPRLLRSVPRRAGAETLRCDRGQWALKASTNPDLLGSAVDGDLATRWYSLQQPGQFFEVDLGEEAVLNGVVLDVSGQYLQNAPRGYRVQVSRDGETWSTVAENPDYRPPLTEFLRPRGYEADIAFPAVAARHVRIVQTGRDDDYRWSVSEIHVTTPSEPRRDSVRLRGKGGLTLSKR